jgi:hypothetical protein
MNFPSAGTPLVVAAAFLMECAKAGIFITSNDPWDVSQGAIVTGTSGWSRWTTQNTVPNILGADVPVLSVLNGEPWPGEHGAGFFAEDNPAGFTHRLEWSTPSPVTLVGYNLFANSDQNPSYPGARGFSSFRLLVENPTTQAFDLVDTFSPGATDYYETFSRTFASVTGDRFRAEFIQTASADNGYVQGPRIRELDAVAVPEPSSFIGLAAAALACFSVLKGRNRQG